VPRHTETVDRLGGRSSSRILLRLATQSSDVRRYYAAATGVVKETASGDST